MYHHTPAVAQLLLWPVEMLGQEPAAAATGGSAPTAWALHAPKGKTAGRQCGERQLSAGWVSILVFLSKAEPIP